MGPNLLHTGTEFTQTRDRDPKRLHLAGRAAAGEQSRAPAKEVQREDRPACHSGADGAEQVCVGGGGVVVGGSAFLPLNSSL